MIFYTTSLRIRQALVSVAALWSAGPLAAQFVETTADLDTLPQVPPGFEITLFAQEPLVRNPCSLAIDAEGRMFVGMGPQYRNPAPDTPPDSVVIVQDTTGDGVADRTHLFATGFNCIQGLAWHGRDLWVANAPDLTVVRDADGDDVADEYIRVFTDLGNIEHGLHGLNWAPDGKLYMSKGNSKGVVIKDWKRDEPDRLAPKVFRELWDVPGPVDAPDLPAPKTFTRDTYQRTYQDPRDDWGRMGGVLRCDDMGKNPEIVSRGLRNPYDITFDDGFDWLGTDQDQNEGDRIIMPFYGAEFGWSHAWSTHWTGRDHLPTAPISGPVFTGSGTGIVYADSPAWPQKYRGVYLINDWLLKSTHIYRPAWDGALRQPQGGTWEEFIAGKKALYRPVDMEFGQDGALYLLGWGRGYGVERDAAGNMTNEGRIFRLIPRDAATLPPPPDVPTAELTVAQLLSDFDHDIPVRRINAQDELVRRGAAVHETLISALEGGKATKAQETWTLWALGRSSLGDDFFVSRPGHANRTPNQRLQAIRILGHRKSAALATVLEAALADPEPRIRFAAVQAVHQAKLAVLADKLLSHAAVEQERLTYYATWRALRDLLPAEKLRPSLDDARPGIRGAALLALLDLQAMPAVDLQRLATDGDQTVRQVALLGLGQIPATPAPPVTATHALLSAPATNIAAESKRPYLLGTLTTGQPSYTDRPYVFQQIPDLLHGAAIIRTANNDEDSRGGSFLTFDLPLASAVMVAHDTRLKDRPPWLRDFADTDLTVTTNDTTFRLWTKDFPAGVVTLGGNVMEPTRGKANYFVVLQPTPLAPRSTATTAEASLAALHQADPKRGEALFFLTASCATCHRTGDRGINFGPDLTNSGDRLEARFIVQSLLEPNAVITEGFAAHAVEAGGQSYFGMLLSTGKKLKLGLIGGTTVELAAESITKHEVLPISPMPPQGALLGPQEVADITAWLLSQKSTPVTTTAAPAPLALNPAPLAALEKPDRLIFIQEGATIGEFLFHHPAMRRPGFANLRAPGGIPITRHFPPLEGVDPTDHADLHPGVWLGFGDLAGHDFWRNKGTIRHDRFIEPPTWKEGRLTFSTGNTLITLEGSTLAAMTNHFTLTPQGQALRLVWDAAVTPASDGFYFGDQEEMGLGVRVATAITETNGGLITLSSGATTAAKTWGQPAAWCDYSGIIAGHHVGIMIVPDPANQSPSWWHNRDYGVFVANAFGRQAMKRGAPSRVEVKRGATYHLKHTIILHTSENGEAPDLHRLANP